LTTEKELEKGISEIVGVFTDPILVFPGGWGDTLPDWIKEAVTMERLVMNMKALKGEEMTGTDAEACAYLYTACLTQPPDHDWAQIYLYVAGKVCRQHRKAEVPEDILVESLNDDQARDLARLKAWIYEQRAKIRLERDRAERRQRKEEAAAEKKALQPALFDL
jgi:hypothetical protein